LTIVRGGLSVHGYFPVASSAIFGSRASTETRIMAQSETRVSPAQLAHYLRGIKFPAGKRELKADAKNNQAPPEILKFIDELPEEQYHTMAEVMKAVGEIE
jgi:hypothetical protein